MLLLCCPFDPASLAAQGSCSFWTSPVSPLAGTLHIVLQFRFCNPTLLLMIACPSLICQGYLSSWHTLTVLLTARGFYSKAIVPVYVHIVYCCDIQSVNNFCNIAQLPKHTAHSLGNHAHSVPSAGSVAQASWISGLEESRTSHYIHYQGCFPLAEVPYMLLMAC